MSSNSPSYAKIFTDESMYATPLCALLVDMYDMDFTEWDPVTLSTQIREDTGISISEGTADRIQSGIALLTTNSFNIKLEMFGPVCNALSFRPVVADTFIPTPLEACMWGCTEAKLLTGSLYSSIYVPQIARYVGQLLDLHGIWIPPAILSFAEYPPSPRIQDPLPGPESMHDLQNQLQLDKKADLEQEVQDRLSVLLSQLALLPLKHAEPGILEAIQQRVG